MTQRFVLTCPSDLPVQLRVAAARDYLGGLVQANRMFLRERLVPPLYSTRTLYRQEPQRGEEEFADAVTVHRRGWGDCDDLAAWRCAELRNEGLDAVLLFRAHPQYPGERRLVHCLVRLPPTRAYPHGQEEDPAKLMREAERRRSVF